MEIHQIEHRTKLKRDKSNQAISLATQGNWDEAAAVNQELLDVIPDDVEALNRLGKALSETGRYADACKALKRALEISPSNSIARRNLDRLAGLKDQALGAGAPGCANLPFQRDGGFGAGHPTCPCVRVGVQLDAMNASSYQLHMMAGRHGKSVHNRRKAMKRYPIVALETEPGDATVHYGCGLHAGPAPTGPLGRRTLYVQHYNPRAFDLIGAYQGYNQIMPGYGEGEILNIDEMQEHSELG